ncbi:MAG: Holliday junction resolvase RuvX [Planctomycetia bacterium]|nr:Holliday junction resolvase RuvX [Planctomycetia bacterium]
MNEFNDFAGFNPSKGAIPTGRVVGIDYGTVRIGVAISDSEQKIASPYEIYTRKNPRLDEQYFRNLAQQERVAFFVVGLPLHPSGDESEKSKEARDFAKWLTEKTGVETILFDERFSSKMADELMREAHFTSKQKKARRDKLAAYVILASWLESDRSKSTPNQPLEG